MENRNQGFDLTKTSDPIYIVDHDQHSYKQLDKALYDEVCGNRAAFAKL
jgi:hypothetical protein